MAGYFPGQTVRLTGTFYNLAGQLANPTTVTVKVQDAAGAQLTYADAVNDSVGVWHKDVVITKPGTGGGGTWYYNFGGVGALVAAGETSFPVQQTVF